MGQRYDGTLVIQTKDSTSPTGNYVLSVLSDQAEEKDIINNKQGYNGTGNIITGTNKKGYAGQVFSETEMDSYLTEENVGRILQYLGQAEGSEGGTPAPVNPIAVGDILESTAEGDEGHPILYLNTTITPDFSQFPEEQMLDGEHGGYPLISLDENGGSTPFITALKAVNGSGEGGGEVYGIVAGGETILYAFSSNVSPSAMGVEAWGWQVTSPVIINRWGGEAKVTAVNQQDIWGAYLSKDGQWTSGGGGGTATPANSISVGDTISTLYFDTSVDVLSLFAGVEGTSENGISFAEISDTILVKYMRGAVLVSRVVDEAPVTVYYMSQDVLGLGWTGWNPEFSGSDIFNATVSSIDADNDKYLSFISKTPFTGGSAYTTGATYQVVNDGTAIVFKEIRI